MPTDGAESDTWLQLTAALYRDAPNVEQAGDRSLRFGLPKRQFVHVSAVGTAWTLYNTCFIILVSFTPDVLAGQGHESVAANSIASIAMWAMLISIPFGGRILEDFGWITVSIAVTLTASAAAMMALSQGIAPEVLWVAFGVVAGIPAGALMRCRLGRALQHGSGFAPVARQHVRPDPIEPCAPLPTDALLCPPAPGAGMGADRQPLVPGLRRHRRWLSTGWSARG